MLLLGTNPIETERLLLRRFTTDDTISMYNNWASLEECTRYFPWNPADELKDVEKRLNLWICNYSKKDFLQWGIELKRNKELIGVINLHNVDQVNNSAETSFIITPSCWKQGLMTEALHGVLNYAFQVLEINRVCADFFVENKASEAVMKKNGMTYEGISREKYYKNGKFFDSVQFAILRSDWIKEK